MGNFGFSKISDIIIRETPTPLLSSDVSILQPPAPLKSADVLYGWSPIRIQTEKKIETCRISWKILFLAVMKLFTSFF